MIMSSPDPVIIAYKHVYSLFSLPTVTTKVPPSILFVLGTAPYLLDMSPPSPKASLGIRYHNMLLSYSGLLLPSLGLGHFFKELTAAGVSLHSDLLHGQSQEMDE